MLIKEQEVIIAEDLLLDVVMPYMEEGVEEGEERAFVTVCTSRSKDGVK